MSTQPLTHPEHLPERVDLAIVTALREELEPILDLIGGEAQWRRFELDRYIHYAGRFPCGDHTLHVVACSLWAMGGNPATAQIVRLKQLQPRLIVMTGICAGWQEKDIHLGDVMVADRAFTGGAGKLTAAGFQADIMTYAPPPWLLGYLKSFAGDEEWVKTIETPRPHTMRYQAEWLLCQLKTRGFTFPTSETDWSEIRANNIDYSRVRKLLIDKKYLTSTGKLIRQADKLLTELSHEHYGKFVPTPDKPQPAVHYKAFASSDAVVAVPNPFSDLAKSVRGIGALEMEVASLLSAAIEIGVPAFAVKGVCDYGTPDKDDVFHVYAAEASARWMYAFICRHATLLDQVLPGRPAVAAGASPAGSAGPAAFTDISIGGSVGTFVPVNISGGEVHGPIIGSQQVYGATQPQLTASASQEAIDQQRELLDTHRRTLANYLRRLAQIGSAHAPPEIDHGIRETRAGIKRCKATLRDWGVLVADHPDDGPEPLQNLPATAQPVPGATPATQGGVNVAHGGAGASHELTQADRSKLAGLLYDSGRAAYASRGALCIEIHVDPGRLAFMQAADRDFATQLVAHLHKTGNIAALRQLCEAIAPELDGQPAARLEEIQAKLR